MGQAIPSQDPAVVLRSHYRQLRALLAIALAVVVGLSVALVIVANNDESTTAASLAKPGQPIEYGDFNPQTGRPLANGASPNIAANPPIEYGDFNPQTGKPLAHSVTPDEGNIAAAISNAQQSTGQSGPNEANVASSIANGTADASVSQARPSSRP
jgi:hypothetical protein